MIDGYDVFLSHNSKDKHIVEQIGRLLREKEGINPFLDKWHLTPGKPWQEELEQALQFSQSLVVFVGPHELGPWNNEEMRIALDRRTKDPEFPVIPVLLPGATMPERGKMPAFLSRLTWVDMREGIEDEVAFARLVSGIRGEVPGDFLTEKDEVISGVPYRGLEKFRPEDAVWFFGREAETQQLVEKLKNDDFIAILGASGSGKSSVALAGLVPAVQQGDIPGSDNWPVCIMSPKYKPLEELAVSLCQFFPDSGPAALLNDFCESKEALYLNLKQAFRDKPEGEYLLLVIDQFEEIFTLCEDETERQQFVDNLLFAALAPEIQLKVVLTMRADFLAKCTPYTQLTDILAVSQFIVTPLVDSQMREAIQMPAKLAGLQFEPGLVERIMIDIGNEPGGLPLLQYALFQLWEKRQGNELTIVAYDSFGGVSGALSQTADQIYAEFSLEEQTVVKQIMLALVQLGEGTEDTRRRVPLGRFAHIEEQDELEEVVQILTDSRLLTTERGTETGAELQVAHEALIRNWGKLRAWIDENRESLKLERRIQVAAEDWEEHGKPNALLLRGPRLAEAIEWLKGSAPAMNLKNFVQRSQRRQLYSRVGIVGTVFIILAGLLTASIIFNKQSQEFENLANANATQAQENEALYNLSATQAEENSTLAKDNAAQADEKAFLAESNAAQAEKNAELAEENALRAEENLRIGSISQVNELTYRSANLIDLGEYKLAGLLIKEALQVANSFDFSVKFDIYNLGLSLLEHMTSPDVVLIGHTASVNSSVFSPDGSKIVTASDDGTARVWTVDGEELAVLEGHTDLVLSAVFSPDGRQILTASADNTARVWTVEGTLLAELAGHEEMVNSAAFSRDGGKILTVSDDFTARVWTVRGDLLTELKVDQEWIGFAAFSPDGTRIITIGDGKARLWSADGEMLTVLGRDGEWIKSAAFSPDGNRIIILGENDTAQLWSAGGNMLELLELPTSQGLSTVGTTGFFIPVTGGGGGVVHHNNLSAFSPDGSQIVTVSDYGAARVWSADGGFLTVLARDEEWVESISFSPDGSQILTVNSNGTVWLWSPEGHAQRVLVNREGWVKSAAFSPDGSKIVTASYDGTAQIWSAKDAGPAVLAGHSACVTSTAYNPDGSKIVTASGDGTARVWSSKGELLAVLVGHQKWVNSAAFSPDGSQILTASDDGTARLWSAEGKVLAVLAEHTNNVNSAVFSPDGSQILTASGDGTARLWSLDGEVLAVLTGHLGGVNTAAFSPNGSRIVTASGDGSAWVWSLEGKAQAVLAGHEEYVRSATFSPDSSRIVTISGDGDVRLWTAKGDLLEKLGSHEVKVDSVSFSPDGDQIVLVSDSGRAWLWLEENEQVASLDVPELPTNTGVFVPVAGLESYKSATTFSPDGNQIVTASCDGNARIWPVLTVEEMISLLDERINRELTEEECQTYLHRSCSEE